nr:MAG TPA: hypothetical protein [Caudoviricetes sp.]
MARNNKFLHNWPLLNYNLLTQLNQKEATKTSVFATSIADIII